MDKTNLFVSKSGLIHRVVYNAEICNLQVYGVTEDGWKYGRGIAKSVTEDWLNSEDGQQFLEESKNAIDEMFPDSLPMDKEDVGEYTLCQICGVTYTDSEYHICDSCRHDMCD